MQELIIVVRYVELTYSKRSAWLKAALAFLIFSLARSMNTSQLNGDKVKSHR